MGGPGRLPAPSPGSVGGAAGGGGGGMAGQVLPGGLEQGRGGSLASKPRVEMAGLSGK